MNDLEKGLNALNINFETDGKQYKIPTTKENLTELLKAYMYLSDDLQQRIDEALTYIDSVTYITKTKLRKILKG